MHNTETLGLAIRHSFLEMLQQSLAANRFSNVYDLVTEYIDDQQETNHTFICRLGK